MKPLISTDQEDLLLFVFLVAGTVGGFTARYYWKTLMTEKEPKISMVRKINGLKYLDSACHGGKSGASSY